MDSRLASLGYELGPSKYSPALGYTSLKALISGHPTERFFDVKTLHIPTYDGRYYHPTQISRHELDTSQTLQVCLGQIALDTYRGEHFRVFSFGGSLQIKLEMADLHCELTSNAPILKQGEDPMSVNGFIADEILDLLSEAQVTLGHHEDELYSRLAKYEPYPLFLACMISLQKRLESVPLHQRHERFRKGESILKHAIQTVRETDGWDGSSPTLEDLLSKGGAE
jgi:hypothetical protein